MLPSKYPYLSNQYLHLFCSDSICGCMPKCLRRNFAQDSSSCHFQSTIFERTFWQRRLRSTNSSIKIDNSRWPKIAKIAQCLSFEILCVFCYDVPSLISDLNERWPDPKRIPTTARFATNSMTYIRSTLAIRGISSARAVLNKSTIKVIDQIEKFRIE